MGRIPVRWPAPVDTAGAPPASDPVKGAAIEPVRPVAATVPAQEQKHVTLNLQSLQIDTMESSAARIEPQE